MHKYRYRCIAILVATLMLLGGALTASAAARHPDPATAPLATADYQQPAVHATPIQLAAIATARQQTVLAIQAHITRARHLKKMAWHTAHLAHLAHLAWLAQLAADAHAAHLAQLAAIQAQATRPVTSNAAAPAPTYNQKPVSVAPSAPAPVHASGTYSGGGGFQQCVIARESGGNSQVMNSSGHYGLYQFSASTWAAYGGSPASFGNASVAQQNQVFANAMAQPGGASNWSPYDGCAYTRSAVQGSAPVHATLMSAVSTHGDQLLNAAETRTGDWYVYGAAGPNYFDCSGLVYWAARQIGISLPRTTYGMPSSGWLYWVPLSQARRGDLMFYGTGHVEIMTAWYHTTFGAQHSGTRVGWHTWNAYWAPTMAYRLR